MRGSPDMIYSQDVPEKDAQKQQGGPQQQGQRVVQKLGQQQQQSPQEGGQPGGQQDLQKK